MDTFRIIEVYNEHPTEDDRRRHQEGLRILARIIVDAMVRDSTSPETLSEASRAPVKQPAGQKRAMGDRPLRGRRQKSPNLVGEHSPQAESAPKKVRGV